MFNMDEDQTLLQTLMMDTDEDEQIIIPTDTGGDLNLKEVKMVLPHLFPSLRR